MEENINKNGKGSEDSNVSPSLAIVKEKPPEILPIIPFHDRPAFPKMMRPIVIDNQELIRMILENAEKKMSQYVGVVLIKSPDIEDDRPSVRVPYGDLYTVGVAAKVLQISQPQDDMPVQVIIQLIERFELSTVVTEKPIILGKVKYWYETAFDNNEELKAYSVAIVDSIKELVKLNPLFKEGLTLLLERININDPGALSDFAASMTTASAQELQKILEIRNVRCRIEEVLILLKREVEISKLKIEISKRIEDRLSKQQREFFLKQQLKEIKKELGLSKDDAESEIEKFQKRISKLVLSDEAREHINEEIEKLKLLEPVSPEFNVSRNYLDWLTVLPWGVYTEDNYDIDHAAEILNEDHYGLKDVKDRILEFISVGILKGSLTGSIILLVGPPGVGKTSVGQSIARSLGREFYRFSLGGIRDEAEIKGHRRTYIGALPGKFLMAIKTCKTSNPVIMLDEIDKIGASFRGDPASALLEVLDPEQNKTFLDHYLDVRFDLSHVLFICTANQLDTIPAPLVDRMEVIQLSGYVLEEKLEIARQFLIPKQMKAHGLQPKQVIIPKDVLAAIIDGYSREAGVRGLENNIRKILRKSVKSIVNKDAPSITIKKSDLDELLGRRYFTDDKIFKKPRVGVVMGLAYTTLGGAALFVESTAVPSSGPGFKHTGQMGDVMVESAEIAYTYVRSMFRKDENVTKMFSNHLIHLHVPAGATPKDGPSAGITMASSIYSLVKNTPPVENLAMTGELTLTGRVIPIGGVKEKVIAANRAKVSQLIFPAENKDDFEKLDDYIKSEITPHFVDNFEEVLKICFPDERKTKAPMG